MRLLLALLGALVVFGCQPAATSKESVGQTERKASPVAADAPGLVPAAGQDSSFSMSVPPSWLAFDLNNPKFKEFFASLEKAKPDGAMGMKQMAESQVAHFIRIDTSANPESGDVIPNVNVHSMPFGKLDESTLKQHAAELGQMLGSKEALSQEMVELPSGKAGHHWGSGEAGGPANGVSFDTWLMVNPQTDKCYTVTFTFPTAKFEEGRNTARTMVETIKFGKA